MSGTLFVINPAGRGGAGVKVWERLRSTVPDQIESAHVRFTERAGHAREIAAAARSYDTVAAVGGDGTVGEVLSGIMDQGDTRSKLAIVPGGTGNDIARSVGISSLEDAVQALQRRDTRKFDVVRVDGQRDDRRVHIYSMLSVAVGFSSIAMVRPWMKRFLGPKLTYYLALLLAIIVYRPPHMRVRWSTGERSGRTWMVLVCNCERIAGGSMCVAPGACVDDGEFNVSIFPAWNKVRMVTTMLPKVPAGDHVKARGVSYFAATHLEVDVSRPAVLDVDGDLFGTTPARFTICPQAVEICCPP